MVSFVERLRQAEIQLAKRYEDPLLETVTNAIAGFDAISTVAILNLVGLRPSTANARRIARSMRTLGYIPIKSRLLEPGSWRSTSARGWARPHREPTAARKIGTTNATDQRTSL